MEAKKSGNGGHVLRKGARGDDVRELQQKLARLGYDVKTDGIFGDDTEKAVIQLQTMFGYTVDALVGDGTRALIDAQIGHGWNAKAPDAAELALRAQGKGSAPQAQPGMAQAKPMPAPQAKPATPPNKSAEPAGKSPR